MEAKIERLKELLELMIGLEEYELCHQIKSIIDRYESLKGND